jgi:hypothetical protein
VYCLARQFQLLCFRFDSNRYLKRRDALLLLRDILAMLIQGPIGVPCLVMYPGPCAENMKDCLILNAVLQIIELQVLRVCTAPCPDLLSGVEAHAHIRCLLQGNERFDCVALLINIASPLSGVEAHAHIRCFLQGNERFDCVALLINIASPLIGPMYFAFMVLCCSVQ